MYDACISIDNDGNDFYGAQIVRARKAHTCGECGETIKPGDDYERVRALSDGYWWGAVTCLSCQTMRDSIFDSWMHGDVWANFEEIYGFSPFEVPEEEGTP